MWSTIEGEGADVVVHYLDDAEGAAQRLAVFLASSDADYVTGSTYVMDGGLMRNLGQGA